MWVNIYLVLMSIIGNLICGLLPIDYDAAICDLLFYNIYI